ARYNSGLADRSRGSSLPQTGRVACRQDGTVGRSLQPFSGRGDAMRTRSAWALGLSAALLPVVFVGLASGQTPGNVGRQLGNQALTNATNAAVGQPAAAVPGQPGAVGVPTTPGQAVQGIQRQAINNATSAVTGQPVGTGVPGQPGAVVPGQPGA